MAANTSPAGASEVTCSTGSDEDLPKRLNQTAAMPASCARATSRAPGSAMPGVPASLTSATAAPPANGELKVKLASVLVVVAGGVAANRALRATLEEAAAKAGPGWARRTPYNRGQVGWYVTRVVDVNPRLSLHVAKAAGMMGLTAELLGKTPR